MWTLAIAVRESWEEGADLGHILKTEPVQSIHTSCATTSKMYCQLFSHLDHKFLEDGGFVSYLCAVTKSLAYTISNM